MPFFKIEFKSVSKAKLSSSEELAIIPSPDEVPIFFISEIGDGFDLLPLLTEINQQIGGKNPIYLYCHPALKLNEEISLKSFEETGELIARELEGHLKADFHPCIIVSTSLASSLALSAAECLAARKKEAFLCFVEGATPEVLKNYFLTQAYSGTIDILKLFEKIANRIALDIPHLTHNQIEAISYIPLKKRIEKIEEIFIMQQTLENPSKINYFKKLNQISLKYFEYLSQHQSSVDEFSHSKLSICNLISKELINKFNQNLCGWDRYKQTNYHYFDKMPDFLNQDKEYVASIIVNYIKENINEEYLVAKMWKDVAVDIDDYEKKHKKVNLLKKIKNAINLSAAKISGNAAKKAEYVENSLLIDGPKEEIQHEVLSSSENETFFLRRNNTFPMFSRSHCLHPSKDAHEKELQTNLLLA